MFSSFVKNYLAKTKTINITLAVLLFISIIAGYVLAKNNPGEINKIFIEDFRNMVEPALSFSPLKLFEFIFLKNLATAIIAVFSGVIFGFIPILTILLNGLILGAVSYFALGKFNILVLFAGLAPHGIVEIPALIFSAASGFWLWRAIWRRALYGEKVLKKEFLSVIKFLILIISPMLFIAAMIEAFITPHVLDFFKSLLQLSAL